jgi:hypothetical protein
VASRIVEKQIIIIKGDDGSPGNLIVNTQVDLVAQTPEGVDATVTVYPIVQILAADTMAQVEVKRAAAYKQAWIDNMGSLPVPANCILLTLKVVAF